MNRFAKRLMDFAGGQKLFALAFAGLLIGVGGIFWRPLFIGFVPVAVMSVAGLVALLILFWTEEM